jgi:hypothetical protein
VLCLSFSLLDLICERRTPGGADSSDEVYFYASRGLGGKWFWRSMAWDMVRRRCWLLALCPYMVAS